MLCEHLRALEADLKAKGMVETYRGQPWSRNCREWVFFDCFLDRPALRARLALADCVRDYENDDPHTGQERGLVCEEHHDAIVGLFEAGPEGAVAR